MDEEELEYEIYRQGFRDRQVLNRERNMLILFSANGSKVLTNHTCA
jgi:hypothetical protein